MKKGCELMTANDKGTHLSFEDRKIIETGISNGSTKTAIAKTLGKDNSTVGKEIDAHRALKSKCTLPLECSAYRHCKLGRNCTLSCPKYVPFKCTRRDRSPGAYNGCSNYSKLEFSLSPFQNGLISVFFLYPFPLAFYDFPCLSSLLYD